jgi:hypothetical protein
MSTENKRFFFVLALPRCQTAWLSVFLSGRESFCFHEGTARFPDWRSYVAALRGRPELMVGDSSPALVEHADDLLAEFPGARFMVIARPYHESLAAFCAAAPQEADGLRAGWERYVALFESAIAKLPVHLSMTVADLDSEVSGNQAHLHLLGAPMDLVRWHQLRDLNVSSTFPPVKSRPASPPLTVEVNVEGFDFAGLAVRSYDVADRPTLELWWMDHRGAPMADLPLPPLGIIVEDGDGPACALWCFETYGTGVAWIEMPITRPGLAYKRASTVLAFAVMALTKLAGAGYEPRGEFTRFRICCPPPMARMLRRIGFRELPPRSNLLLCAT